MKSIWTMGEIVVEIMRSQEDVPHSVPGEYIGPFPSGAPAIFIDTVARLGGNAGIIGGIGIDPFGECIKNRLLKDKVDCRFMMESEEGTTAVTYVMYRKDGSREFMFHWKGTPAINVKSPDIQEIADPGYIHLMGCSLTADELFRGEVLKTVEKFRSKGAKISFDPNIRPEHLRSRELNTIIKPIMEHCSVFLPGVDELLLITEETEVDRAVAKLFDNLTMEIIALKQGSRGSVIYTRKGKFEQPAYAVEQLDATGAGDCFDGGFMTGLILGKSIEESAQMGAAAGALNAAAFGPMEGKISMETVREIAGISNRKTTL